MARRLSSGYNGPADPDALRDEIASRVFAQFDGGEIDPDEITTLAKEQQSAVASKLHEAEPRVQ